MVSAVKLSELRYWLRQPGARSELGPCRDPALPERDMAGLYASVPRSVGGRRSIEATLSSRF
jgi:hypothetical protein